MVPNILPEDDDIADGIAADLVMQEPSSLGEGHVQDVTHTLALNRQNLMLEEAGV